MISLKPIYPSFKRDFFVQEIPLNFLNQFVSAQIHLIVFESCCSGATACVCLKLNYNIN